MVLIRMLSHRSGLFLTFSAFAFGLCLACGSRGAEPVPPLFLEEAIRLALAKNYAVKIESYNGAIARANLTAEWGRFDPSIQLRYEFNESGDPTPADPLSGAHPPGSITSTDTYQAGVGGLMPWGLRYSVGLQTTNRRGTSNNFQHQYFTFSGLTVEQPLLRDFGFGAGLIGVRIAKTDRAISDWDYRQAITDTITRVVFAYHDLYLAQANLRVSVRSRELAASLLAENERRFEVGNVAESDVTAARARVAFREDSVLRAERMVDAATNYLRQLISDERTMELLAGPLPIQPPAPPTVLHPKPADDFATALALRPDYQRMRLLTQRRRLNKSYYANQLLPEVSFVGSYGYHGLGSTWPESRRAMQDRNTRSYTAGAVVTIPLTFAQERGRYRAASLQVRQAEAQVEELEQRIVVDLGNAAAELDSTQKRIAAAQKARQLAQKSLDDELKLHRAGRSSTLFVLQAQEYLSQAELNEFLATADAHKAVAEYDRQLGRTLERHAVKVEPGSAPRS